MQLHVDSHDKSLLCLHQDTDSHQDSFHELPTIRVHTCAHHSSNLADGTHIYDLHGNEQAQVVWPHSLTKEAVQLSYLSREGDLGRWSLSENRRPYWSLSADSKGLAAS